MRVHLKIVAGLTLTGCGGSFPSFPVQTPPTAMPPGEVNPEHQDEDRTGDEDADCGLDYTPKISDYQNLPGTATNLEGTFKCQTDGVEDVNWHPKVVEHDPNGVPAKVWTLRAGTTAVGLDAVEIPLSEVAAKTTRGLGAWTDIPNVAFSAAARRKTNEDDVLTGVTDGGSSITIALGPSSVNARAAARTRRYAYAPDDLVGDFRIYQTVWQDDPPADPASDEYELLYGANPCQGNFENIFSPNPTATTQEWGHCVRNFYVEDDLDMLFLDEEVTSRSLSLESIMRHEAGHFLGMAHSSGGGDVSVMTEAVQRGEALITMSDDECELFGYMYNGTSNPASPPVHDVCSL